MTRPEGTKSFLGLARLCVFAGCVDVLEQIETFGRVTLEAMSCGLACVVNRECGDHLVKVRENGLFFQCLNISGISLHLRNISSL